MPIASPKYPFTRQSLERAPGEPGVYALYDSEELIYVGRADLPSGIQARLLQHLFGVRAPSMATHYAWEICRDPLARQATLIREFERTHLRPPRYNNGPTAQARQAA